MTRRILVLFPDEWDREAARDPRLRERFEFAFAGFDLFSFPGNTRLFTFDALRFVERRVRRYSRERLDAVVTSDEQFSMVCEEIARGRQVTANGFVRHGKVAMLPGEQLAAVDAVAARLLQGLGYAHGMFNIEMRIDPATGQPRVIEINPRAAGQFYDLFGRVDGLQRLRGDAGAAPGRGARAAPPPGRAAPRGELRAARPLRRGRRLSGRRNLRPRRRAIAAAIRPSGCA